MIEWNDFIILLKLSLRNMYMYYKIKQNMKYILYLVFFWYLIKFKDFIFWLINFIWWYVFVVLSFFVFLVI